MSEIGILERFGLEDVTSPEVGETPTPEPAAERGEVDAWPVHDVLTKLADAADILFDRHDYDGDGYEQIRAARDVARVHARALSAPTRPGEDERERLGRIVREVWVEWAREQPSPKPSWLVPWEGLSEPDKEVDRRIGVRLFAEGARATPAPLTEEEARRWAEGLVAQLAVLRAPNSFFAEVLARFALAASRGDIPAEARAALSPEDVERYRHRPGPRQGVPLDILTPAEQAEIIAGAPGQIGPGQTPIGGEPAVAATVERVTGKGDREPKSRRRVRTANGDGQILHRGAVVGYWWIGFDSGGEACLPSADFQVLP